MPFQDARDTALSKALAMILTRQRSRVIRRDRIEIWSVLINTGLQPGATDSNKERTVSTVFM